ncbi:mechanosensitive ion channel protein MscS [Sulfurifustis variabilis]|uniref:Mechanosensitive ion channel protein MscS n=1 Tax=Sulfurifustis variabilis TaxID=1675686 RepID=A0A1B4V6Q0_9GAMM|nr:mechanosensitive ion channel domain-containing protein [Sulfurifustis variabilis]BAU49188.1 mechanosensitive ion channel protein MscS [Sulfurifustis variabilis]
MSLWPRLQEPAMWWQLGVLLSGLVLALWLGQRLQSRLQAAVGPPTRDGLRRVAVRTGALVTVPLLLWLWLLAGSALLRQALGIRGDLLHYLILAVGAFTLVRMGVFVLRHTFSPGSRLKAWEGALTLTIWGLLALHIFGWLPVVSRALDEYGMQVGATRVSLLTVTSFALSMALLLILYLWIVKALSMRIRRTQNLDASMKAAAIKLTKLVLLTSVVVVALVTAGIDITTLTVIGGALVVGVGLGLQKTVSNYVAGFVLIFEESVRPGDVITVGDTFGIVQELNSRHVVVRTGDGLDVLVPNEELVTNRITSWSYGDRNVRLRVPVQIGYDVDPDEAIALLEEIGRSEPRILPAPAPQAFVIGFGDNGVNLELMIWIGDPESGMLDLRSRLHRKIWRAFRDRGITIPYPQRVVRVETAAGRPAGEDLDRPPLPRASGES